MKKIGFGEIRLEMNLSRHHQVDHTCFELWQRGIGLPNVRIENLVDKTHQKSVHWGLNGSIIGANYNWDLDWCYPLHLEIGTEFVHVEIEIEYLAS